MKAVVYLVIQCEKVVAVEEIEQYFAVATVVSFHNVYTLYTEPIV